MPGETDELVRRLQGEDLVLTFIDTDNYTPAAAALEVVRERTVPGGRDPAQASFAPVPSGFGAPSYHDDKRLSNDAPYRHEVRLPSLQVVRVSSSVAALG